MTTKFKAGNLVHWKKEAYAHGRQHWFWAEADNNDHIFLLLSFDGVAWKAINAEGIVITIYKNTIEEWMEVVNDNTSI